MSINSIPGLPPRFEVRQLGPEHLLWVTALQLHANLFHSDKWRPVFAGERARRCLRGLRLAYPTLSHPVSSGLSYGIFDTQFAFTREESRSQPAGGGLYWSEFDEDTFTDEDGEKLLEAMDFPLVSFALAHDDFEPTPKEDTRGLAEALPEMALLYNVMDKLRKQNEEATGVKRADAKGQRLNRTGTATRRGYESMGLMKALAHFEMRFARDLGFESICINTSNPAVLHVWSSPPSPFRSEVVQRLSVRDYVVPDEEGRPTTPFVKSSEKESVRILCHLQDRHGE